MPLQCLCSLLLELHFDVFALVICSREMCDQHNAFTMCPLCDKFCDYWNLSSACGTARASHLFDNPATVFFSIFMALWGEYLFKF